MLKAVKEWFQHRWLVNVDETDTWKDYQATFGSVPGQRVLQHLMDNLYCTIYGGTDPNEALAHNARRSVVHEILLNLENPNKTAVKVETGEANALGR